MTSKYDIYIAAKNLDANGEKTEDSHIAERLYLYLVNKGFRVFFHSRTLEKCVLVNFKKEIDAALDDSKVLVLVATSNDYINSPWVRYEWNTFFNDILSGIKPNGNLFGYFKNMSALDLPRVFRHTTNIEHGSDAFEKISRLIGDSLKNNTQTLDNTLENKIQAQDGPFKFYDVFISYVEEDSTIIKDLVRGLENAGYRVWYYERDSLPGLEYFDQVVQSIDESRIIIVIISLASLSSTQVNNEITYAHETKIPILPILKDISHSDYQRKKPGWRIILGGSTSIRIPDEGIVKIIDKIVLGTQVLIARKYS